jgi:hypothetical protein
MDARVTYYTLRSGEHTAKVGVMRPSPDWDVDDAIDGLIMHFRYEHGCFPSEFEVGGEIRAVDVDAWEQSLRESIEIE